MRLINVHSRLLEEFYDANVPEYAILSHTWGDDEVTYEDMTTGHAREKDAYRKIRFLCTQAVADGLEWAWVDTCCINKTSSAELSEAINSMFRWYRRAQYCYAFLSDVTADLLISGKGKHNNLAAYMHHDLSPWLAGSRWFKRGWCLQELIAPQREKFYGRHWNYLGDREALAPIIARITGIREKVLLDPSGEIGRCSVAEKMSWAASRETSRVEDTAYCLLGIFEVNMPMVYGEGMQAFQRLQEEIIKSIDDHSIFVWQPENDDEYHLLLAPEPNRFTHGALIVTIPALHHVEGHTLGNTGLRISLPMSKIDSRPGCYHAILGCRYRDDYQNVIALCLHRRHDIDPVKSPEEKGKPQPSAALLSSGAAPAALYVAPTIAKAQRYVIERAPQKLEDFPKWPRFMISRKLPVAEQGEVYAGAKYWFNLSESSNFSIVAAYPPECYNSQTSVMDLTNHPKKYGAVLLSLSESRASASGLDESLWHSQSVAVVFGSWSAPGNQDDAHQASMGIFGVVQSNLKNLANACRLAVSKSIYRSTDARQHSVAWVRSTYAVTWGRDYLLDVSFRGDRKIGLLSEVVNMISMTLRAEHELSKVTPMPLFKQVEETDGNPLSVARLQDVVRSYADSELDDRLTSHEGPQPGMVYELEDDSWRAQHPDEDSGDSEYEDFAWQADDQMAMHVAAGLPPHRSQR